MAHSLGYPTDIDRQPDREGRSREKQSCSMTWQSRRRSKRAYVSTARILNYSNTWYNNYLTHPIQRHHLCHSRDFNSQSGWPLL